MKDYLIRAIDKSGSIRLFAATTTNLVEEARRIHETSATVTAALGRTLTIGAMMGKMMKNDQDILTLKINGNGPVGGMIAVANNKGEVKGVANNPKADLPARESDGKLDVRGIVGDNGTITVIMDLGLKEPYVGQTSLVTGEIAEDIANYYMVSEQTPSVVSLGVLVDKDISCRAAGGFMIQVLPDTEEEDIVKIEKAIENLEPVSTMIDNGMSPEDIMNRVLGDFEMEILEKSPLEYYCNCNREKIESVIVSLGNKEIENIIEEDKQAEVVCHFCNTKYQFDEEELEGLLDYK